MSIILSKSSLKKTFTCKKQTNWTLSFVHKHLNTTIIKTQPLKNMSADNECINWMFFFCSDINIKCKRGQSTHLQTRCKGYFFAKPN